MVLRDGGVIAENYDAELDKLRALSANASEFLLQYEAEQKEQTGISGLKVGYNRAARMVEQMENEGVVGPQEGTKPREVFVSPIEP